MQPRDGNFFNPFRQNAPGDTTTFPSTSNSGTGSGSFWRPPPSTSPSFTAHSSESSHDPQFTAAHHDGYSNHTTFDTESVGPAVPHPWEQKIPIMHKQNLRQIPLYQNRQNPPNFNHGRTMGDYLQPETVTAPSCITFPYNGGILILGRECYRSYHCSMVGTMTIRILILESLSPFVILLRTNSVLPSS